MLLPQKQTCFDTAEMACPHCTPVVASPHPAICTKVTFPGRERGEFPPGAVSNGATFKPPRGEDAAALGTSLLGDAECFGSDCREWCQAIVPG